MAAVKLTKAELERYAKELEAKLIVAYAETADERAKVKKWLVANPILGFAVGCVVGFVANSLLT